MEIAFGILGSIASIVGLLLPAKGWRQRTMHITYGVAIIILAYFAASYQKKLGRIASIERAANHMVADREMKYTHLGYVQATLSFLEKNKDLYPDTYQRALDMCKQYRFNEPQNGSDIVELSFAMQGILKGLATIDSGS